jgi:predicted dehydrogenase
MGGNHADSVLSGKVKRVELAAVSDVDPAKLDPFKGKCGIFTDNLDLIRSGKADAVLIATPHYAHTTAGIQALDAGLHVMVEKPISVHKADCERLIAAHRGRKQVFAAMFNQRTDPRSRKVKQVIESGELGTLMRMNWIVTTWFRSEAYYASGGWRATWGGEGGGVLLNQCPHQLDLLYWFFGRPARVTAFCSLGKHHNIEVEDEVTAFLEYPGGVTGVFVTSTAEAPGTNRLEVTGTRGRLVLENDELSMVRNEIPSDVFSRTTDKMFGTPPVWNIQIPVAGKGGQHVEMIQNFVDAVLDGTPLIAPAEEGIHSVEVGNAMLFSGLTGKPVDMPLDGAAFERHLRRLVKGSRFRKQVKAVKGPVDFAASRS